MAYTPKTWVNGDIIYADDLNHIENGIAQEYAEYNILDYSGSTLNAKWDAMKADFTAWQYKHIIVPHPRLDCAACIQVGNDIKWKLDGPLEIDDTCNCADIEIYGELYAVAALTQAVLIDDVSKPENINFINGIQIRGKRADGHTIGNAIEIRAGSRINFLGQTIINDCGNGVVIGGSNQSKDAEAFFDKLHIAFFDINAVQVHGDTYPAIICASRIETFCAQNQNLDAVLLSNNIPNTKIGAVMYSTDVSKDGYTTNDAKSVLHITSADKDTHNIVSDFVYGSDAANAVYLDVTNTATGTIYDVQLGVVGTGANNKAIYARDCKNITADIIKRDNLIDIASCYYSRFGRHEISGSDSIDRFTGLDATVNIDGTTAINTVPAITNKEIGAITVVKNANGKRVYLNDGSANIQIDGQMFVPAVTSLPAPDWTLRGKMYRINNDAGTDTIAVCIRYEGTGYKWFNLITGTVIT